MARSFDDGSSQYLQNTNVVVSVPFAASAWFYSDDLTISQTLWCLVNATHYHVLVLRGAAGGDPLSLGANAGAGTAFANSTSGYSANTWQHACGLEVSATDRRVLLDGGNKGTDSTSRSPSVSNTEIGRVGSIGLYMSGRIAEVGVWDLSAWPGATDSDKADNFEAAAVPALALGYSPAFFTLGLVCHWALIRDEDQDRVGGYDMTPYNSPTVADHPPKVFHPLVPLWGIAAVAAVDLSIAVVATDPDYLIKGVKVVG